MLPGVRTPVRAWLDSLRQDARFALSVLRRNRGFTAVCVLSLALGIGVNLAIFSFVNALFLRPIPGVAEDDRLVAIHHRTRAHGSFTPASYPDFDYYRRHATSFTGVAAHTGFSTTVRAGDVTERVGAELVSDEYFLVLGTRAAAGRVLEPRDGVPGAEPAVVLSYDYWQRRFGADAGILGRTIRVGAAIATVVGVAERGFAGLLLSAGRPSMWVPIALYRQAVPSFADMDNLYAAWGTQTFDLTARLKPDADLRLAAAEMRTLASQLDVERAGAGGVVAGTYDYTRLDSLLIPARQSRVSPSERRSFVSLVTLLGGVAGLVLLIGCFNVANLMVARTTAREHEMAVRTALGASWKRIAQQVLVETVILSCLATAVAIPAALWTSRVLTSFGTASPLTIVAGADIDGRVLACAAGLALVTGVILSLLPARVAARTSVGGILGRRARGVTRSPGLQSLLVAGQVAVSVVLLVGAGLFVRTLLNALAVDVTVRSDQVLLARLDPGAAGYDASRGGQMYAQLLDRIRALPGVADAAQVMVVPLGGRRGGTTIEWSDAGAPRSAQLGFNAVSTRHFQTIGVPIVAGRDFTDEDRAGSPPVAIVNQTMADRLFAGRSPIGQRLVVNWRPASVVDVIGVVRDGKFRSYRSDREPTVYVPLRQRYMSPITLEVRAADPMAVAPAIRRELAAIDKDLTITAVQTARAHFDNALWRERLMATLVGGVGCLALLLVAIGLYGILSFVVAQRTREIGVRIALGARVGPVLWLVVGRALAVVGAGVVVGAAVAAALARYVRGLLYEVEIADPAVMISGALLLLIVALIASVAPARRAATVDPVTALRAE